MEEYLEYNDVLLVPKYSDIRSRDDINLQVSYKGIDFDTPIFAAPMDSFYKGRDNALSFLSELYRVGVVGFVHRFDVRENRLSIIHDLDLDTKFGVSVGLLDDNDEFELAQIAVSEGATIICIDVASGHNTYTIRSVEKLKSFILNENSTTKVMVGNVASYKGFRDLQDAGADFIRVGIGSGSVCTTRNMTGVGVPQITLLQMISEATPSTVIVADGGIRYSGDIVKALAAGANMVMMGYMYSGANETSNGTYRGMASRSAQEDKFGFVRSIEGIEIKALHNNRLLVDINKEILDNIRSGLSYLGVRDIKDIKKSAEFIKVTSDAIKRI